MDARTNRSSTEFSRQQQSDFFMLGLGYRFRYLTNLQTKSRSVQMCHWKMSVFHNNIGSQAESESARSDLVKVEYNYNLFNQPLSCAMYRNNCPTIKSVVPYLYEHFGRDDGPSSLTFTNEFVLHFLWLFTDVSSSYCVVETEIGFMVYRWGNRLVRLAVAVVMSTTARWHVLTQIKNTGRWGATNKYICKLNGECMHHADWAWCSIESRRLSAPP